MLGKKEDKVPTRKSFNGKSVFSDKIFKIKLCGFDSLSWLIYFLYYRITSINYKDLSYLLTNHLLSLIVTNYCILNATIWRNIFILSIHTTWPIQSSLSSLSHQMSTLTQSSRLSNRPISSFSILKNVERASYWSASTPCLTSSR